MISDDAYDSPTAERVIDIQPRSARLNVRYHDPPADITPRPGSDFLLTPESLEVTQPFVYQPPVLPEPLIPPIHVVHSCLPRCACLLLTPIRDYIYCV